MNPLASKIEIPDLVLKRKLMKMVGSQFHLHDRNSGAELFVANQKGFKLKEEITITQNGQPIIGIYARKIMDFSGSYDLVDLTTEPNLRFGVMKRKGFVSSMLRDEWLVFDGNEAEIGSLKEDLIILGLLRRFLSNLIPQNYDLKLGEKLAVDLKQNFNPFTYHLNVLNQLPNDQFDRRIGLAASVLIAAIEGRQN